MTEETMGGDAAEQNREPDCEKVKGAFEKWLEGAATKEDEAFLAEQADECSPCFENVEQQRQFVDFLKSALRRPGAPAKLVDSIKSQIHHTTA